MKAALVVNRMKSSMRENLNDILNYIKKASQASSDLVIFPEVAITGLCLTDNPLEDIKLGLSMDSLEIAKLCNAAKNYNINVAIGILEKENVKLYDTAIYIDRDGEIISKYRRITSGWRDSSQDSIYKEGCEIKVINTEFGKGCFLICGDLFEEELVSKVREESVEYLFFPFARCLYPETNIKEIWEREIFKEYLEQMKKTNAITLAANYLDEYYFGGAFSVDKEGRLISYFEIGQEGMLIIDV